MGMDVLGIKPKNECAPDMFVPKYLPLRGVAPAITAKCKHWYSNDFDVLNGEDSILVAGLLQTRRSTVVVPRSTPGFAGPRLS